MPEIIELGWCGARRLAAYKLKWTVRCCRRTVSVGGIFVRSSAFQSVLM